MSHKRAKRLRAIAEDLRESVELFGPPIGTTARELRRALDAPCAHRFNADYSDARIRAGVWLTCSLCGVRRL